MISAVRGHVPHSLAVRLENLLEKVKTREQNMKQSVLRFVFIVLIGSLISGCVIGNKYKIADVHAKFHANGKYSVVIASLDKRPFIIDKTSPDTYVGMVRGRYGNPFNATTYSGLPFSDDVSQSICNTLNRKGFKATFVTVKFDLAENEVIDRLLTKNEDRALLVIIQEWESDSFYNLNVGYNFILKVIAKDGTILATVEAKDALSIEGSIWRGSLKMSKKEVPNILRTAIESLLNNPDVVRVLAITSK